MKKFDKLYESIMKSEKQDKTSSMLEEATQLTTVDKFFSWYTGDTTWGDTHRDTPQQIVDGGTDLEIGELIDDDRVVYDAMSNFAANKKTKIKIKTTKKSGGVILSFTLGDSNYQFESDVPFTKLDESILDEKVYRLSGSSGTRTKPGGKILQAFKKVIEKVYIEDPTDFKKLLVEVNKAWKKWAKGDGKKLLMSIIEDGLAKSKIDQGSLKGVSVALENLEWEIFRTQYLESMGEISIQTISEFIVNINIEPEVDHKFLKRLSKRVSGMRNSPLVMKTHTTIFGEINDANNNIEIRDSFILTIDKNKK